MERKCQSVWTGKILILLFALLAGSNMQAQEVGKRIYIPKSFADPNNENSQWCYARSRESENFIIFWEAGYGANPQTVSSSTYRVNVDAILRLADECFEFYADSLKFITRGASNTDDYKMIIRLFYQTEWMATGLGEDDVIGELNLSANAAQAMGVTLAHEVGHCFQYQVYADQRKGGWRYGLGNNGAGGNGYWEQCAQWQAFKVFPEQQFTDYRFSEYLNSAHKHILHETPRYANYFLQDYWCDLHGMDFIGRLWRESKSPEDPVDVYKRITRVSQTKFNDEMYDCAAKFVTWDIPALREKGEPFIDSRPQCQMSRMEDGYWVVDSAMCPENYGYNVIKLNAPAEASTITACFEGWAARPGYRNKNRVYGEWRYGFVALLKDGTRVYGDRHFSAVDSKSIEGPYDTITFDCPANCEKLWMVVSAAPRTHWHHEWDDNDKNDEQWPYRVKFEGTNLYGMFDFAEDAVPHDTIVTCHVNLAPVTANTQLYPSTPVQPDINAICHAFCLNLSELKAAFGKNLSYAAVNPNGSYNSSSTANAPGHWFNKSGAVTTWGNNSYIFSELQTGTLTFNIGQYPNKCRVGEKYTIRQALIYRTPANKTVRATIVFNISILSASGVEETVAEGQGENLPIVSYANGSELHLMARFPEVTVRDLSGRVLIRVSDTDCVAWDELTSGVYLITASDRTVKVLKP